MSEQTLKRKIPAQTLLHKLFAGVALLIFVLVIVVGVKAGVRLETIVYRSALAMLVVGIIGRGVLRVLTTYEEMNSDEG